MLETNATGHLKNTIIRINRRKLISIRQRNRWLYMLIQSEAHSGADNIIVHRNEPDYLFPSFIMLNSVSLSLMLSMNGRSCLLNEDDFISRFTDYTHVMCWWWG